MFKFAYNEFVPYHSFFMPNWITCFFSLTFLQRFLARGMRSSMNAVLNPTLMSHLSSKSEGEHCTTFLTSLFHVFSSHQWLFLASLFLQIREKNFHLVSAHFWLITILYKFNQFFQQSKKELQQKYHVMSTYHV